MAVKRVRGLQVKHEPPDPVWRKHQNDKKNWEAMVKLGADASQSVSIGGAETDMSLEERAIAQEQARKLDERLQAKFGKYQGETALGHYRFATGDVQYEEEDEGISFDGDVSTK